MNSWIWDTLWYLFLAYFYNKSNLPLTPMISQHLPGPSSDAHVRRTRWWPCAMVIQKVRTLCTMKQKAFPSTISSGLGKHLPRRSAGLRRCDSWVRCQGFVLISDSRNLCVYVVSPGQFHGECCFAAPMEDLAYFGVAAHGLSGEETERELLKFYHEELCKLLVSRLPKWSRKYLKDPGSTQTWSNQLQVAAWKPESLHKPSIFWVISTFGEALKVFLLILSDSGSQIDLAA